MKSGSCAAYFGGLSGPCRIGGALRALVALALFAALLPAPAEARPRTLTAPEVSALLTGNTVRGFNPEDQSRFKMFHSGTGTVRAELRGHNGQVSRSDGRWWVSDDGQLCVEWENFRWVNSCAVVRKDNETVTFLDQQGRVISFGEVVDGNPDDL